jgi:hypothetical protein
LNCGEIADALIELPIGIGVTALSGLFGARWPRWRLAAWAEAAFIGRFLSPLRGKDERVSELASQQVSIPAFSSQPSAISSIRGERSGESRERKSDQNGICETVEQVSAGD